MQNLYSIHGFSKADANNLDFRYLGKRIEFLLFGIKRKGIVVEVIDDMWKGFGVELFDKNKRIVVYITYQCILHKI